MGGYKGDILVAIIGLCIALIITGICWYNSDQVVKGIMNGTITIDTTNQKLIYK